MKKKLLFKIISATIVLCVIFGTIMPTIVRSVAVVVSSTENTGHGIGKTKVYTAKINGYNNIYCLRGGAHLGKGTQLDDNGYSVYSTKGEVIKDSSAIQWLLDNIYLIEDTNTTAKKEMKNNLINIVKQYSKYKDSNGNYILSKKIGVNNIDDNWIKNMVDALLKDTSTLYAVQQYSIWNHVKNTEDYYYNAMKNSDGTYNSIPGAKVDKKYYTALYITLDELSKEAQKNGYKSPNASGSTFDIKLEKQSNTKVTVSDDGKTALVGPYKLSNNHRYATKTFSSTVDSNNVDKVETVDKNGKALSVKETQGEFWVKITYNKGFTKGIKHNININVDLSGHKTYAKLLDSTEYENQPVVALRTENYSTQTSAQTYVEEINEGRYNLILEKINLENPTEKIEGVSFSVKEGNQAAKKYGPTNSQGSVTVVSSREITEPGVDAFTLTEVDVAGKDYIKLKDEITIYVTKVLQGEGYLVKTASFEKDKEVISKEVTLEDGTKVTVNLRLSIAYNSDKTISVSTIRVTIPNKPKEIKGKYSMIMEKVDLQNPDQKIEGVTFKVKEGEGEEKVYGPTDSNGLVSIFNNREITEEGIDEFTITEVNTGDSGYIKMKDEVKIYVKKGRVYDYFTARSASFDKDNQVSTKEVTLEDGTKTNIQLKIINNTVKVIIPNKLPQKFKFVLNKVDEKGNPLIGADFTVEKFVDNDKEVLLDNEEVKGTYEVIEENAQTNKTYLYKVVEVESAPEYVNVMDGKYITIATYMNNDKKLVLGVYKTPDINSDSAEDSYYEKYGFTINNTDGTLVKEDQTDLYKKIKVNVSSDSDLQQVTITIPNQKVKGGYSLELLKVDAKSKEALQGAKFNVTVKQDGKEVNLYDVNQKEINLTGLTTNKSGKLNISNIKINEETKYSFEIVETEAPEGYEKLAESIKFDVQTKLLDSEYKIEMSNFVGPAKSTLNNNTINITVENTPKGEFDLSLRKFITKVNDKEVTSRIPVFKIDENGNYVYNHDKEPVLVANSNIVTYTLRVYNEGTVNGYAREIKDDIPQGLEFLPDDSLNKEYRWIMLDKYGKETDNVDEAKYIVSDYLSKEQEATSGANLLKAFDKEAYESGSIKEPDYKEVKVSFKVNMPDKSDEIIINQAQISDDSDEDGNDVTDKDSTPNEWIEGEDDQDIEKIRIQYFDLALRKWVTKAIVYENGKETIHETGHKAEDDPEAVVKVDLNKSNINDVTVKFEYKIRVENQGKIAGYAKEVSDYIPEGLKFVPQDNPNWKEVEGKVVTDELKDTLLQPGETAEVTILLTWINKEDNMGLKVNTAEISKDYNEYGTPDIDSTPNNKVPGEDDIDDAPVMLTVKTGEEPTYIVLSIAVLTILATGLVLVKKYVLR